MTNDIDWVTEAGNLSRAAQNDEDFYAFAAADLLRPNDRLVVDFGCGGGGMAIALGRLAAEQGQATRVVGVDGHPAVFADTATAHPELTFVEGSFETDPATLLSRIGGAPNLIWARGAVHHAADEQAALTTLAALLAPGGVLAIAEGGTTAASLPDHLGVGRPGLHTRLHAAMDRFRHHALANRTPMPYGWGVGLREAGLTEIHTRNILVDKPGPLTGADLDHVLRSFTNQVTRAQDYLDADDTAAWNRLLDDTDPAWLGLRDDLFYLAAASIHIGVKPNSET